MTTYLITCGALSYHARHPNEDAAWDEAWERFGHLARISVSPA